jgi:hypothetical protein
MILGIMQPYFFPFLGHFDLIRRADRWVVFDLVQYIRHGWINRNRILHPTDGWQYVIVPVRRHARATLIRDVEIDDGADWRNKILGQLRHYRRRAPHFEATLALVARCLEIRERSISRLNAAILAEVSAHLGIRFRGELLSEMDLPLPPIQDPGDWALEIASRLGARTYVNPAGGAALFDPARFAERGIGLELRHPPEMPCARRGYASVPGLSIIDVLMWSAPEEVRAFLDARTGPAAPAGAAPCLQGVAS